MYRAKVTSKGQVTIPMAVREKLGLRPGDMLEIRETADGYVIRKCVRVSPFDRYVGFLRSKAGHTSDGIVEEMRGPSD
ncbi:MAG: AbrB/MazE/SpoVT family DNA-binding domain-containing protein [Firmicutes bacterium]|jgi:AbrB family looped-hinge helix DNA binding protein|nr:AbrB/MazE/SpoVT family DNA-binding domain-containing protein [Bacillota bacterium]MDH7495787.1 AbrB/MazE/SpoVT family DNA-binding domain-containing protein [Bacillota bacterium]